MWMSKSSEYAKAHFIEPETGKPACTRLKYPDGSPYVAPFKCSWIPLQEASPKCKLCKRALREGVATKP